MTRNRITISVGGLTTLFLTAVLAPAYATSATPRSPHTVAQRAGLSVVGFDPTVARAHGYKILTYADGSQQSVPADPKSTLPKSPIVSKTPNPTAMGQSLVPASATSDYDSVTGDCGTAWISVVKTGASQVSVASGANTYFLAVWADWHIGLADANGQSSHSWTGAVRTSNFGRTWSNLYQHFWTADYITHGEVRLTNGAICISGTPVVTISGLA